MSRVKAGVWEIAPRLYVGSVPTLETIQELDIKCLVTVSKKRPSTEVITAVPRYHYVPIRDGRDPQAEETEHAALYALKAWDKHRRTMIHCLAGRNRSVMVAGRVLYLLTEMSGQEVLHLLRTERPNAIHNPVFEAAIEGWGT